MSRDGTNVHQMEAGIISKLVSHEMSHFSDGRGFVFFRCSFPVGVLDFHHVFHGYLLPVANLAPEESVVKCGGAG